MASPYPTSQNKASLLVCKTAETHFVLSPTICPNLENLKQPKKSIAKSQREKVDGVVEGVVSVTRRQGLLFLLFLLCPVADIE